MPGDRSQPVLADTHCHLGHIEASSEEVLAQARQAGVGLVVDIGMGLAGSAEAAARASSGSVLASVGLHPNDLDEFVRDPDSAMSRLEELSGRPGVVAVGETGLDFYRDRSTPELQEASFAAHIELSKKTDKTLVIHCRDAHAQLLEVLDREGPPQRVIMHCFSGDEAFARACAERGFWCSVAGNITYKRADDLRAAARLVPEQLLLVETDAPYLAPHPHRGKPNSPKLLPLTADALAEVRGLDPGTLRSRLADNTRHAFSLT